MYLQNKIKGKYFFTTFLLRRCTQKAGVLQASFYELSNTRYIGTTKRMLRFKPKFLTLIINNASFLQD